MIVCCLQVFTIVNSIYLCSLGLVTLPLYSIAVQMGGDFKPSMLSVDMSVAKSMQSDADAVQDRHVSPDLRLPVASSSHTWQRVQHCILQL